jgi:sugar phosphate isomerase/epimerase
VTQSSVVWQHTFDGLCPDQIDEKWVERGGGLESYVFDGRDLAEESHWRAFEEGLRRARSLGAAKLTAHFPTDNADWVGDPRFFEALVRFCDLAVRHGVEGVVLHTNQFVVQDEWRSYDVLDARRKVVDKLADLDERLKGYPLWIGVENLPVIGSQGIDYDPVFVYPCDFDPVVEIGSDLLGVTWDLCHWAITVSTAESIAQLLRRPVGVTAYDLPQLPVRHLHFGSFSGHAMPFWAGGSFEGATPQNGEVEQCLLAQMLRNAMAAASSGAQNQSYGVVFEVQEQDYRARTACWETLEWVSSELGVVGLPIADRGRPRV